MKGDSKKAWTGCVLGVAALACAGTASATCTDPLGDLDGSGLTTIVDVQCAILAVLDALAGGDGAPACLAGGAETADLDCNLEASVADVQIGIGAALGQPLSPLLDADGSGCPDACDIACDPGAPGAVVALYDFAGAAAATPADFTFYDAPFPALGRLDADGTLGLSGLPNPPVGGDCILEINNIVLGVLLTSFTQAEYRAYVAAAADADAHGAGVNTPVAFRFSGAVDASRLPTPEESIQPGATAMLVDVDPASPTFGQPVPIEARVFTTSAYVPPNTVSLVPVPGFPLRPGTRYAAFVRRDLRDVGGAALGQAPALTALLAQDPAYVAALSGLGASGCDLAALTVFDTRDTTAGMEAVAAGIDAIADPAPLAQAQVQAVVSADGMLVADGTYNTLMFQRDDPPYLPHMEVLVDITPANVFALLDPNSYLIDLDPTDHRGELLVAPPPAAPGGTDPDAPRTANIPFKLALPADLGPAGGEVVLPVVLHAHGTGGSRSSMLGAGNEAQVLTGQGFAVWAIDQVLHGVRARIDNVDPALAADLAAIDTVLGFNASGALFDTLESGTFFFNPLQIHAARGNAQQAAVDAIWLARLLADLALPVPLPGGGTVTVRFDSSRIYFFGHSQGGLTGPLTAVSTYLDGYFLSGAGGHLTSSLLDKTKPSDPFSIKAIIEYVVCETAPANLDLHHPVLAAMMAFFEPADGVNYARLFADEPLYGAKHVFFSEGVADNFAPPSTNESLTTAARIRQVVPVLSTVQGQVLLDALFAADPLISFTPVVAALALNAAGGSVTAGFKQYSGAGFGCADDHFVYRCVPQAKADWTAWFQAIASGAAPAIAAGP